MNKGVLPTPIWVVIGAALGAATGAGRGGLALFAGLALGAAAGAGVAYLLSRRGGA